MAGKKKYIEIVQSSTEPEDLPGPTLYTSIAIGLIREFVPSDYNIKCVPAKDMFECGTYNYYYRAGFYDAPPDHPKNLRIPCPETPECLFWALHEIAHVANKDGKPAGHMSTQNPELYKIEMAAWNRAKDWMEKAGVEVTPDLWAKAMEYAETARSGIAVQLANIQQDIVTEGMGPDRSF